MATLTLLQVCCFYEWQFEQRNAAEEKVASNDGLWNLDDQLHVGWRAAVLRNGNIISHRCMTM